MLLHAAASAALQRHAAADGFSARGWLVGVAQPSGLVVLSAARLAAGCADLAADLAEVSAQLPPPLRVLGPYAGAAGDEATERAACAAACAALRGSAVLTAAASGDGAKPHRFADVASGAALATAPAPDGWLADTCAVLRCRLRVLLPANGDEGAAVAAAEQLGGAHVAWLVQAADGAKKLLTPPWGDDAGGACAAQLVSDVASPGGVPAVLTPLAGGGAGEPAAPLLTWKAAPAVGATATTLDVLLYAQPAQALSAAVRAPALATALHAQASAAAAALRGCRTCEPGTWHFHPPQLAHPIAVVYARPASADVAAADVALAPARAALHARWGLPNDVPLLRLQRALAPAGPLAAAAAGDGPQLREPHVLAPPSGVAGATAHLVAGSYLYYHYKQDRFDDAGWGCAYRSCQTLVSWLRLQGHTGAPVPSHGDIQRALVALGDKEPSFIGSRQWIGAIELMYVLMASYDVQCKMLAVPAGADVAAHVRALAAHFDSQGTPVMIGGGVLAYTLLGVDWNERTGEAAFLILDPHYIGPEDAAAIVPTWCGWRRAEQVFVPDAFYNFLCPQRPTAI